MNGGPKYPSWFCIPSEQPLPLSDIWQKTRKEFSGAFLSHFDHLEQRLRALPHSELLSLILFEVHPIGGKKYKFSKKGMAELELQFLDHQSLKENTEVAGKDWTNVLSMLSAVILTGNRECRWDLPLPGFYVKHPEEKSRIAPPRVSRANQAHRWRQRFLESLEAVSKEKTNRNQPLSSEARLGQLLLSAVLFGGLLDRGSIRGFCRWLCPPRPDAKTSVVRSAPSLSSNLVWLDLVTEQANGTLIHEKRWFPDPITETLLVAQPMTPAIEWANPTWLWANDSLESCLRAYYREADWTKDRPLSLTDLITATKDFLGLEIPSYLVEYAESSPISTSLSHASWSRLLGLEVPETDKKEPTIETEPSYVSPVLVQLHATLESPPTKELDACLKTLLEETPEDARPIETMLIDWVRDLLHLGSSRGKQVSAKRAKRLLYDVGYRLVNVCGELSPWLLDEEELADLEDQLLANAGGPSNRRNVAKSVAELWHFLDLRREEQTSKNRLDTIIRQHVPVDANIVTPDEYTRALELQEQSTVLRRRHPDYPEIAQLLTILGYRCGLRRSEAFFLRMADVIAGRKPEILIRPYKDRQLKSSASQRKIPLYALLSDDELRLFLNWVTYRQKTITGDVKARSNAKLFGINDDFDDKALRWVYTEIHETLREASGYDGARYHWLRHTFGTRLVFGLLTTDDWSLSQSPLRNTLSSWIEDGNRLRQALLPRDHPTRKLLYLISSLLGHSSPEVSLKHYIHCQDLLLYQTLKKNNWSDISAAKYYVSLGAPDKDAVYKQFQMEDGISTYLHGLRHRSIQTIYKRQKRASAKHNVGSDLWTLIRDVDARLWRHFQREDETTEHAAKRIVSGLSCDVFKRLKELTTLTVNRRKDLPRHKFAEGTLPPLRDALEIEVARDTCQRIEQLAAKGELARTVFTTNIEHFAHNVPRTSNELRFNEPKPAKLFVDFLISRLGYPSHSLDLSLEMQPGISKEKKTKFVQRWRFYIDPKDRWNLRIKVLTKGKNTANNPRLILNLRTDWLDAGSEVVGRSTTSNPGAYGFRYAMLMAYIVQDILGSRGEPSEGRNQ